MSFYGFDGLTKTEWFAGMAMQGMLANPDGWFPGEDLVEKAYELAELMEAVGRERVLVSGTRYTLAGSSLRQVWHDSNDDGPRAADARPLHETSQALPRVRLRL